MIIMTMPVRTRPSVIRFEPQLWALLEPVQSNPQTGAGQLNRTPILLKTIIPDEQQQQLQAIDRTLSPGLQIAA